MSPFLTESMTAWRPSLKSSRISFNLVGIRFLQVIRDDLIFTTFGEAPTLYGILIENQVCKVNKIAGCGKRSVRSRPEKFPAPVILHR
jgi:hypothetical protein